MAEANLFIDIETYSPVDLKKSNVYAYVAHPDFRILMCAYARNWEEEVQITADPQRITEIAQLTQVPGTRTWAHNAAFERICFSRHLGLDTDHGEYLDPETWEDTQALAGEHGYPQRLEELALALGGEEKDSAGTRLINLFSKPNRKGERTLATDKPQEWYDFKEYCRQDVVVLREVAQALPGWPSETERQLWYTDQRINDRGIRVDVEMAQAAVAAAEDNKAEQMEESRQLTGLDNPNSSQQLTGWLSAQGVEVPNLQKDTITGLLAGELSPPVRRVLELRQELALVASKKYIAALDRVNADERLRGSFHFFGAHTGRWAGRGVQLQNLPSASLTTGEETESQADTLIEGAVLDLKLGLGASAHTLKALVRPMFQGPFTVVDYSAIEARVVAWLAGEEWALQAFRDGRDIYVETAQRMSTPSHQMTRKEGKVAVLALGYNGGTGSLEAMGATGSRQYLQTLVDQWRGANENIVQMWQEMDHAFRRGGSVGDHLSVETDGRDRLLRLPSGRAITYHDVRSQWVTNRWGNRVPQLSFADPKRHGWRADTYGGRLTENVTQAVARDVLAEALIRLDALGYDVVGHVHDEILVEGAWPGSVEEISEVMCVSPTWAEGLPIAGAGYRTARYRKD